MDLKPGLDFRLPKYRREVFLRFYEFHLKYRSHPGCVYYTMPWLKERLSMGPEDLLWMAFVNGNTQNIVTTWLILRSFPTLKYALKNRSKFEAWFREVYVRLAWDIDRRHHKLAFPEALDSYAERLGGQTQVAFFAGKKFPALWDEITRHWFTFGRLSTFSYTEYLRIVGLDVEPHTLFLDDIAGSRSHRNGLCKLLGWDHLDWHSSNPTFDGYYSRAILDRLELEGGVLLGEARQRFRGRAFTRDVTYFTLESALCTFKSWFRKNRRYPNVYNDMFHDRIRKAERAFSKVDFSLFWEARRAALPAYLRQEDNPTDPGLCPRKQNWFRETGQVLMMDNDWPCFKNDFYKEAVCTE